MRSSIPFTSQLRCEIIAMTQYNNIQPKLAILNLGQEISGLSSLTTGVKIDTLWNTLVELSIFQRLSRAQKWHRNDFPETFTDWGNPFINWRCSKYMRSWMFIFLWRLDIMSMLYVDSNIQPLNPHSDVSKSTNTQPLYLHTNRNAVMFLIIIILLGAYKNRLQLGYIYIPNKLEQEQILWWTHT